MSAESDTRLSASFRGSLWTQLINTVSYIWLCLSFSSHYMLPFSPRLQELKLPKTPAPPYIFDPFVWTKEIHADI